MHIRLGDAGESQVQISVQSVCWILICLSISLSVSHTVFHDPPVLAGHEIELIVDKEKSCNPMEGKTAPHLHVGSRVGSHSSVHLEGQVKRNAMPLFRYIEKEFLLPSQPVADKENLWSPVESKTATHVLLLMRT